MNLSDLRKVTVRKRLRIRFALSNGMECVVNEHGIAQVPALRSVPSFNLEDELSGAQAFLVEPAAEGGKNQTKPAARSYTRGEMTALAESGAGAESAHADHED